MSMRNTSFTMGQLLRPPLERLRETRHELIDVLLRAEQEFQLAEVFGEKPDIPVSVPGRVLALPVQIPRLRERHFVLHHAVFEQEVAIQELRGTHGSPLLSRDPLSDAPR